MKSILKSIKPQYCELIAAGKKTIEVRKTRPKIQTPFKVYIYCCKPKQILRAVYTAKDYEGLFSNVSENTKIFCKTPDGSNPYCSWPYSGKVIGEYVCNDIDKIIHAGTTNQNIELCLIDNAWHYTPLTAEFYRKSCLSYAELEKYSKGGNIYGWHISDLVIYDKPKELSEFRIIDKEFLKKCPYRSRVYNNPDYTNGALLKGGYVCDADLEPDFCRGQCEGTTKPLTRPPQSWCYVEEDMIVLWSDGRFNFKKAKTFKDYPFERPFEHLCCVQNDVSGLKVIGNIHDNPELLKE